MNFNLEEAKGIFPFEPFPKIPRLSREVVVTEKIDGTNAAVCIDDAGDIWAQSRTKVITPGKATDNFGFAAWVWDNRGELLKLGPGRHFGEWWGLGIQRNYGLADRRFSLFNCGRWLDRYQAPEEIGPDPTAWNMEGMAWVPACCRVVPILARGIFASFLIDEAVNTLRVQGSFAAPGFMKPEGVIVYHTAGNHLYKKLLENDELPKALAA